MEDVKKGIFKVLGKVSPEGTVAVRELITFINWIDNHEDMDYEAEEGLWRTYEFLRARGIEPMEAEEIADKLLILFKD